ncbi:hypothetical protein RCL1_008510 [Eukaryota sp. TZLM3-RCL]
MSPVRRKTIHFSRNQKKPRFRFIPETNPKLHLLPLSHIALTKMAHRGGRGDFRGDSRGRGRGGSDRGRGGYSDRPRGGDFGGRGGSRGPSDPFLRDLFQDCNVGNDKLLSNFFKINVRPVPLFVYSISFADEELVREERNRRVVFSNICRLAFGEQVPYDDLMFDGNFIYALREFPEFHNRPYAVDIPFGAKKLSTNFDVAPVRKINDRIPQAISDLQQMEQLHAIILKMALRNSDLFDFRSRFYDRQPIAAAESPEYQVLPGYVPRIMWREGGWFLELSIHNKVLAKGTMFDKLKRESQNTKLARDQFLKEFSKAINTGNQWLSHTKKFIKLDGIDFNMSPRSTFSKNGVETSFGEYFQKTYNINLDPSQPMAYQERKDNPQDRTYFPLQLVIQAGGFPATSLEMMSKMTQTNPSESYRRMANFLTVLGRIKSDQGRARRPMLSPLQFMRKWGIDISENLQSSVVVPPVTKLNPMVINLGYKSLNMQDIRGGNFGTELKDYRVQQPQPVTNWIFMYHQTAKGFAMKMKEEIAKKMGSVANIRTAPQMIEVPGRGSFVGLLDQALRGRQPPQLIFACAQDTAADNYDEFKTYTSAKGLVSQYIAAEKVMDKPPIVIASNCVLQTQAKLGATLWKVNLSDKLFGPNGSFPTLVLGMDVFHQATKPSCVALVGMLCYQNQIAWFSKIKELPPRTEISANVVAEMVANCLDFYRATGKPKPKSVLFYRDGVGETQFDLVQKHEVEPVKNVINRAVPGTFFIFAIVQKRIGTKFFSPVTRDNNPEPGTVVNNMVVRDSRWYGSDFYIFAHQTKIGTATPVHVDILYNDVPPQAGLSGEDFYGITFALCHLYFNNQAAVKVPCVCQYAHTLAYLFGEMEPEARKMPRLQDIPKALADKVFYI